VKLIRSHGVAIKNPTDADIDGAFEDAADHEDAFLMLQGGGGFIQTGGNFPDGLVVGYEEEGRQFRSVNEELSLDEVKSLFKQYRRGDRSWKEQLEWREVETKGAAGGCSGTAAALVLAAGALLWVFVL